MLRAALTAAVLLAVAPAVSGDIPLSDRRSTYEDMSAETRAMQDGDTDNPGMLWVLDGGALWRAKAGKAAVACAGCHGEAELSMKGVAARYPAFEPRRGTAIDLTGRVNICRAERQEAPELKRESRELLALTALIARQSRGGRAPEARHRSRPRPLQHAPGPTRPRLRPVPRRQLGQEAGRHQPAARPPHRLSALPTGMASAGVAAAPSAQLPDRHARRALRLRRAGVHRAGGLPDVARPRHADGEPCGAALTAPVRLSPP
jgi:thiosulfate dehydrogenase/tetrathionate reductase SoxA/TsdA-like protein